MTFLRIGDIIFPVPKLRLTKGGGRTGHDAEMGKERRNQRCWISGS
ncbi:hypothetical protein HMPREF1986_01797 [Oribacterium sp. oral taxon 078 str. F0263]|nr:hypothetical protein HMPREF1986_01797 [Oribacterium sp. oral taxon 078 str. F0263]